MTSELVDLIQFDQQDDGKNTSSDGSSTDKNEVQDLKAQVDEMRKQMKFLAEKLDQLVGPKDDKVIPPSVSSSATPESNQSVPTGNDSVEISEKDDNGDTHLNVNTPMPTVHFQQSLDAGMFSTPVNPDRRSRTPVVSNDHSRTDDQIGDDSVMSWSGSLSRKDSVLDSHAFRPNLLRFDGSGKMSLDDYLNHFRICSEVCGWSAQHCCLMLASHLEGRALTWLDDLPKSDRLNWNALVKHLEKHWYPPEKESYFRSAFNSRKKAVTESHSDFVKALRYLGKHAFPTMCAEAREELIRENFVQCLPSDLLLQLTLTNVTGLDEMIAKADLYDSIKKNVGSKKPIIAAVQKTQYSSSPAEKTTPESTLQCEISEIKQAVTDLARNLKGVKMTPQSPRLNRINSFAGVCFSCGRKGHKKISCKFAKHNRKTASSTDIGNKNNTAGRKPSSPDRINQPENRSDASGDKQIPDDSVESGNFAKSLDTRSKRTESPLNGI